MRVIPFLLVLAVTSGPAAAQNIRFLNATPAPVDIKLEAGSQVSVDANGNLTARCDGSDPAGCQRLAQGGGGTGQCGTGASFTQALAATPAGPVNPGSSVTLQATTSGAQICLPSVTRLLPLPEQAVTVTGWTSALTPNASGVVSASVTLPSQASASYRFSLVCYGSTGSATSDATVQTNAAPPPPPPTNCDQFPSVPFTNSSAGSSTGVAISGVTSQIINGFEALQSIGGTLMFPFPEPGGFGVVNGPPSRIRSIRFTVPQNYAYTGNQEFVWAEYPNNYIPPTEGYISVSQCAGDLRVPASGQGSSGSDLTFAEGCRNWRGIPQIPSGFFQNSSIKYEVSATADSTPFVCVLRPGQTYFFNVYINRPNSNRTLPPLPSPPDTLCGFGAECGIRVQLRD